MYDAQGNTRFELNLGDASEDLQTTPQGLIWVSYFDEGVYGGSIGRQGLVCFDNAGTPLFKYADFAEQNELPMQRLLRNERRSGGCDVAQLLHRLSADPIAQLRN